MKIVWMRSHPGTTLLGARLALGIPASKIYEELWHIQRHLEHGAQGEGSIDTRAPAGTKLRNEMQDTLRQMERGVPQVPHGYKTSGERPPLVLRAFRDLLFRITCWDGTRFTHEAILGTDLEVAARHVDRLATYPAKLGRSATGRRKGWELPVVEQPYTPDFLTRADEPPIKADIAAIFGLEDKELRWESLWNNIKTKLERAQLPGTDHDYVVIDLGESDDRL